MENHILEDLHSEIQRAFAEEIADGKITVTLVKLKVYKS